MSGPNHAPLGASRAHDRFNIPLDPNDIPLSPNFIGRDAELDKLKHVFLPPEGQIQPDRSVYSIIGLGGLGKTQIAAKFVDLHKHRFSAVIWLDASSAESVKKGLVRFAPRIKSEATSTYLVQTEATREEHVRDILAWLSLADNTNWLMVFDQVDLDPQQTPADALAYHVQDFFPAANQGNILLMGHLKRLSQMGKSDVASKMSTADSIQLVECHLGRSLSDDKHIHTLLERLDRIPLSLVIAASYLRETGMTIEDYNERYAEWWSAAIEAHAQGLAQNPEMRPILTMITPWRMSVSHIASQNPDAIRLLKLFSFFSSNGLNYDIFQIAAETGRVEAPNIAWLERICASKDSFLEAVRLLERYSLVERVDAMGNVTIHTLIHDSTPMLIGREEEGEATSIATAAAQIILMQVPTDEQMPEFWPLVTKFSLHISRLSRILEAMTVFPLLSTVCYLQVAAVLTFCTLHAQAESLYRRLLAVTEQTAGLEHQSTLLVMNDLGSCYLVQDKLNEAEELLIRALHGHEKATATDERLKLRTMSNLGSIYKKQGHLEKAERMFTRLLQTIDARSDSEVSLKIAAVISLYAIYASVGRIDDAEAMRRLQLQLQEKLLGLNNVGTLDTVISLGALCEFRGRTDEAEHLWKRALQGIEQTMGPDHESRFVVYNYLGHLYCQQNKHQQAQDMYMKALQGFERAFGRLHQGTLETLSNLGALFVAQAKYDRALDMYSQAHKGCEEKAGSLDAETLRLLVILGDVYEKRSEHEKARELFTMAMQGYEKTLGPRAPATLDANVKLASSYARQHSCDKAEEILVPALQSQESTLGLLDQDTINTSRLLESVYERQGRPHKARQISSRNLAAMQHTLGSRHEWTREQASRLEQIPSNPLDWWMTRAGWVFGAMCFALGVWWGVY